MSEPRGDRRGRRATWLWQTAVVLGVLLPAVPLLLRNPRYFFDGDTQAAYLGWETHLGDELLAGRWPLLDPSAWHAANFVAEGQAGLFSPLVMAIGVLATLAGNVLVFMTVLKLGLACVGATGVFVLARSYGAARPLAFVAGVAVPLGGMTQYLDLSSWVANLMIWALLPWVWWALRRMTLHDARPFVALVLGYLLVSVGYVYGTIMLIAVLVACLVECRLQRDRRAELRVLAVGALCGLVALTVYLPGVLTGPVTKRGSSFYWTGKFGSDPLAMLTSVLPTAVVPDTTLHVLPYAYAAWFLPVLVWVDLDRLRRGWRPVAGLLLMTGVTLLVVIGPARLGPLRWPLRLQPFLVQTLVVLCAVLVSRFLVRRPSRRRLAVSLGWVVLAGAVALARHPPGWVGQGVAVLVVAAGVAVAWLLVRGVRSTAGLSGGALVAAAFTLLLTVLQHVSYPVAPSPERNLPARAADYRRPLSTARGDVMTVGNTSGLLREDPGASADFLTGSAWYLNPHPVQNLYTTIGFREYYDVFPMEYDGSTAPSVLRTLFSIEPHTGRRRVDLLAVSTLLLVRRDFPAEVLRRPPSGWRVTDTTARAVTWVRRTPVPGAGSPVWTSPGTSVSQVRVDDRTTRFEVAGVPAAGGRVVLAALNWPGYHIDAGRIGAAVDGYLLTVDLPAGSAGRSVTVRFSPPGWPLEVAAWWLAVVLGAGWSLAALRRSRRSGDAPVRTGEPRGARVGHLSIGAVDRRGRGAGRG